MESSPHCRHRVQQDQAVTSSLIHTWIHKWRGRILHSWEPTQYTQHNTNTTHTTQYTHHSTHNTTYITTGWSYTTMNKVIISGQIELCSHYCCCDWLVCPPITSLLAILYQLLRMVLCGCCSWCEISFLPNESLHMYNSLRPELSSRRHHF